MTTRPTFGPVDTYTGSLLDLIAEDPEWDEFQAAVRFVASHNGGHIKPNDMRPLLRGVVAPQRIGAFYHRAASQGLIAADGWQVSDDRKGKNSGKPARTYRLTVA